MFTLTSNGKIIRTASSLAEAYAAAKEESLVDGGIKRTVNGKTAKGRIVSVWSGAVGSNGRGTTKHAVYICGTLG